MSITARHKRPGAFRQLVNALETTPEDKRQKIIQAIAGEDPEMASHVRASLFRFEEFIGVDNAILAEILGQLEKEPRIVALALFHLENQALVDKFVKSMSVSVLRVYREETSLLTEVKLRERISAQFRMIAKAREIEATGLFRLKRYAGDYPGMM